VRRNQCPFVLVSWASSQTFLGRKTGVQLDTLLDSDDRSIRFHPFVKDHAFKLEKPLSQFWSNSADLGSAKNNSARATVLKQGLTSYQARHQEFWWGKVFCQTYLRSHRADTLDPCDHDAGSGRLAICFLVNASNSVLQVTGSYGKIIVGENRGVMPTSVDFSERCICPGSLPKVENQ